MCVYIPIQYKRLQYIYNNISGTSRCFTLTTEAIQCRTGKNKNKTNINRPIERFSSYNDGCREQVRGNESCVVIFVRLAFAM
jgi:hypothetical protein